MAELLSQSLHDLKKPSRELLEIIKQMVEKKSRESGIKQCGYKFTRRDLREYSGWGDFLAVDLYPFGRIGGSEVIEIYFAVYVILVASVKEYAVV